MSGSLIGGVIGAVIGFFVPGIGPALGFALGSAIGGTLFPAKGPDGPRLEDLRPQSSEYGRPIPIVYGAAGLAGNVIWASDLIEVKEGKEYKYYANFAVAVCEGERSIGRIWAGPEKRLIWDGVTLEGADDGAVLRTYSGSEVQLPDPLIESYEGSGNVPAYRGTCYLVLEFFPVRKDGNRIPFLTVEVGANLADSTLGIINIQQVILTATQYIIFYWGETRGFQIRLLSDKTTLVRHHQYELADWSSDATWFWDEGRDTLVRWHLNAMTFDTVDPVTGDFVPHTILVHGAAGPDPSTAIKFAMYYQGVYVFMAQGSGSTRTTAYVIDPDTFTPIGTYTYDLNAEFTGPLFAPLGGGVYVFGCTTTGLRKYPLAPLSVSTDAGPLAPPLTTFSPAVAAQDPVTGYIWSATDGSAATSQFVQCTNPETAASLYAASTSINAPYYFGWGANTQATPFVFYQVGLARLVALCGGATLGSSVAGDYALVFNAAVPDYITQGLGTASGGYHLNTVVWNPVTSTLVGFRKVGYLSEGSEVFALPNKAESFYLGSAGVTLEGQTLSTIVADLSERAGLTEDQIDVTELTDTVDGYAIANQTSVRDAITALMPAYYFDSVESEGKVKFVKRGGDIAVVIPDHEVGCFEQGSDPADPIETKRRMENELPHTMTVRYLLAATNYSTATRVAKRLVGSSGEEQAMELPLVMSDTKAQEVAEVNLHGAWVARVTYTFTLPRKYSYLEPTDIIVVYGFTMRLTKTIQDDGIIKCEASADDSNVYVPNVIVTETEPLGGAVEEVSETILELA